jgi:putative Holliday junction resolvase
MRHLMAVDPGDKRIGIAVSDPTGILVRPLQIVKHTSRQIDAAVIAQLAAEHEIDQIVVGMALDHEGEIGPQARKALRFVDALRGQTDIPVVTWDESLSTKTAYERQIALHMSYKKRKSTLDSMAAVVILQSYIEHLEQTDDDTEEK